MAAILSRPQCFKLIVDELWINSVWVRGVSRTRQSWFGNVTSDSTQFGVMLDLIGSWIGVRSADMCPTHNWTTPIEPFTIGGRIWTRTFPGKTNTQSFNHVSKISPQNFLLPDHITTVNWQNHLHTDVVHWYLKHRKTYHQSLHSMVHLSDVPNLQSHVWYQNVSEGSWMDAIFTDLPTIYSHVLVNMYQY